MGKGKDAEGVGYMLSLASGDEPACCAAPVNKDRFGVYRSVLRVAERQQAAREDTRSAQVLQVLIPT